jgi:hypothetical protein
LDYNSTVHLGTLKMFDYWMKREPGATTCDGNGKGDGSKDNRLADGDGIGDERVGAVSRNRLVP